MAWTWIMIWIWLGAQSKGKTKFTGRSGPDNVADQVESTGSLRVRVAFRSFSDSFGTAWRGFFTLFVFFASLFSGPRSSEPGSVSPVSSASYFAQLQLLADRLPRLCPLWTTASGFGSIPGSGFAWVGFWFSHLGCGLVFR